MIFHFWMHLNERFYFRQFEKRSPRHSTPLKWYEFLVIRVWVSVPHNWLRSKRIINLKNCPQTNMSQRRYCVVTVLILTNSIIIFFQFFFCNSQRNILLEMVQQGYSLSTADKTFLEVKTDSDILKEMRRIDDE